MQPTVEQIVEPSPSFNPDDVERIAHRVKKQPLVIVEPSTEWVPRFERLQAQLRDALGSQILQIDHVGSTSVPGLPAKDIVDIDLTLTDVDDEASYVQPLEKIGFRFILREPKWYRHRFFAEDLIDAPCVNLHVWGADTPEAVRHRLFRDWLISTPEDRALYAAVKREAVEQTTQAGESAAEYTLRKNVVVNDILQRAFRSRGYIK